MDEDQEQKPGYVRCSGSHLGTEWKFEVLSVLNKSALVTIKTGDGPIRVGLSREEAERLLRDLENLLSDWPDKPQ